MLHLGLYVFVLCDFCYGLIEPFVIIRPRLVAGYSRNNRFWHFDYRLRSSFRESVKQNLVYNKPQ
ncbi:MAG: hypothetical protein J6Q51_03115 [Clostridia bacterium]|nr:hypothetical protein [Clostridia bacterium]